MPGLKEKDFVELTKSEFLSHFNPILERASKTAHITDEDVEEINKLKINCKATFPFVDSASDTGAADGRLSFGDAGEADDSRRCLSVYATTCHDPDAGWGKAVYRGSRA